MCACKKTHLYNIHIYIYIYEYILMRVYSPLSL